MFAYHLTGTFSPKAYNTIEDAKAAIDDDLDCIAEKYGEQQNKGGTNSANKRIYNE